jgi:arylsulfatase A-like enzyme
VLLLGAACSQDPTSGEQVSQWPNLILIVTDDQDVASISHMPKLRTLLMDEGMYFENFFAALPACAPSRASILRGQYVHNHRIWENTPPLSGFPGFYDLGHEYSTIATWLQDAGYRTALVGKYLNFYGEIGPVHVPPGWDQWFAIFGPPVNGRRQPYFGYFMNLNGEVQQFGEREEDYVTDVLARTATTEIRGAARAGRPFFLYFAPYAPHSPATPAPRHEGTSAGVPAPRPPSFNESDVSDKPPTMQLPPLAADVIERIDALYPQQLESLKAVDDAIETIVQVLKSEKVLENTYILYTSDNGFHMGHHRLQIGKGTMYEEDIRVPLIVRGPNVPTGLVVSDLTSAVDLAPTLADLAGVTPPPFADGRSLVPLLRGESTVWRDGILVEGTPTRGSPRALRTSRYSYIEWGNGDSELYDLLADPFQLDNIYDTADPDLVRRFAEWLTRLRTCVGPACRGADYSP